MTIERGSTWGKWDFHIHTPYSILHNDYGFNPEVDGIEDFDSYVSRLFHKAVDSGIVAIGITDYFSIEGYKRIKKEYLSNDRKLVELFPDEALRNRIRKIFVFPNIELRLETFVGKESKAVNYHVLFSDTVNATDIEESFLRRLDLIHVNNNTLPMTRKSIERIGQEFKQYNSTEIRQDYLVGLEKIAVDYKQVIHVLKNSAVLDGKYLISIPVDEDLSSIDWSGRDYQTRKVLYQQCNMLMTSNIKTRDWALAKGHEEEQISEFSSIMPCIWGSDAHSYDQMFSPSEERFCWIKSDPTFEGLKQVLYEPEERVRIQKDRPEEKDSHQIIDYIVFCDDDFQKEPIYLSEGLTTIIGGKSTGKSILLRHIAKSIDPNQVVEREQKITGSNSKLDVCAKVVWKDGVAGERKIVYIPQSWLNRIVDESSGDSQLNTMIRDILLQQKEIGEAYSQLKEQINSIEDVLKHNIIDYVATVQKIDESERFLREFGRSEAFQSTINQLERQRENLSAEAGITDEILQQYANLEKRISECNNINEVIQREEPILNSLCVPFAFIPNITTVTADGNPSYNYDEISTVKEVLAEIIVRINKAILEIWEPAHRSLKEIVSNKNEENQRILSELHNSFSPLQQLVSKNDQLKKIDQQLQEEKEKLRKAKSVEETRKENIIKADDLKGKILASRQKTRFVYDVFATKISATNMPDSDLEFVADIQDKKLELCEAIGSLFDNRNLRTFKDRTKYNILDKDELEIDDGLFDALWEAMTNKTLSFKGGNTLQTSLERLFSDWVYVHYIVRSSNETINNMSPGKKALVLLEMIVNLEMSKCPILIDQPEDDLDNRSIFTDLVAYLKSKKHERQIIVVTHNANVVIGADAEEVIIANQKGKEAPNRLKRFEYRCGAIENTSPVCVAGEIIPGVLNQKGIQEQICDILEGGKIAFELRRKKYIGT